MFKQVFFDLDGTLLGLHLDFFLQEYFALLTHTFADLIPEEHLTAQVLSATQVMIQNTDGDRTNQEVFLEAFFQEAPWEEEPVKKRFFTFYKEKFPFLQFTAKKLPGVLEILSFLLEEGTTLVLATNPLFPQAATWERMRWAGISHFPFSLVTTYECMHFCKPQLAYYQEILDHIGGDPKQTLMVGNDMDEDMVAKELGITTFLVEEYLIPGKNSVPAPDHRGSLSDLYQYLQELDFGSRKG